MNTLEKNPHNGYELNVLVKDWLKVIEAAIEKAQDKHFVAVSEFKNLITNPLPTEVLQYIDSLGYHIECWGEFAPGKDDEYYLVSDSSTR